MYEMIPIKEAHTSEKRTIKTTQKHENRHTHTPNLIRSGSYTWVSTMIEKKPIKEAHASDKRPVKTKPKIENRYTHTPNWIRIGSSE